MQLKVVSVFLLGISIRGKTPNNLLVFVRSCRGQGGREPAHALLDPELLNLRPFILPYHYRILEV